MYACVCARLRPFAYADVCVFACVLVCVSLYAFAYGVVCVRVLVLVRACLRVVVCDCLYLCMVVHV